MTERERLKVVDAARQFSEQCVDIAQGLPRRAPARLRGQLAESGQAVSDILIEGLGRGSTAEKIHYSRMANGSLEETQNYLRRCVNRQLIDKKCFFRSWNLSMVVSRMLAAVIEYLENQQNES
jgi:four helix bundle protein